MPKILTTIWNTLSGYKTFAGLLIVLLTFLSQWIPEAMAAAQADPALVAKITGAFVTVLGLMHKIYKVAFGEPAK
jgi:hypothetical protein